MPETKTQQPSPQDSFVKALETVGKIVQSMNTRSGGVSTSPVVPQVTPGGGPPRAGMPFGLPQMGSAAGPTQTHGPVTPGGFATGFSFPTKGARDAAVVNSTIGNISEFISKHKSEQQSKLAKQAENYITQIHAAQSTGDQETLNLLLTDPKVIKTLEKGLEYVMPKTPGAPPPPEAHGVMNGLKKLIGRGGGQPQGRLPLPNTPGGVAMARENPAAGQQRQIDGLLQATLLQALQNDPELAKKMAVGTALSGKEVADTERVKGGLNPSADQLAQVGAEDRKTMVGAATALTQIEHETRTELLKMDKSILLETMKLKSMEGIADKDRAVAWAKINILRDGEKIKNDILKAKSSQDKSKLAIAYRDGFQRMITNYEHYATEMERYGKTDEAKKLRDEASKYKQQFNSAQEQLQTNDDALIQAILSGKSE